MTNFGAHATFLPTDFAPSCAATIAHGFLRNGNSYRNFSAASAKPLL